jgi:hypothetical protein
MGTGARRGDPARMFNDLLEITAVEARARLAELEAERALARSSRMSEIDSYMADLEVEIEATREIFVASAVTEIATLRGALSGVQVG